MDQASREVIELMINHLIQERERIEAVSDLRIDCDLKLTYDYITQEIARLNLELFQERYQYYEDNLNKVLKAENRKGKGDVVS
jgi:hypothetical protein